MKVVVTHPTFGIYLGHCLGLGFWSKLDAVGQESAPVFDAPEDAAAHIASWDENNDPADYDFVRVHTRHPQYATMGECIAAGLDAWFPDNDYQPADAPVM